MKHSQYANNLLSIKSGEDSCRANIRFKFCIRRVSPLFWLLGASQLLKKLKEAAKRIKRDAMTIYFAARDPRTPLMVRLLAFSVAAYAISPIDLIPDFIPVLGYLDDLILLPLGIALVIKLTPAIVIESSRKKAAEAATRPTSTSAVIVIVTIWVLCTIALSYWLLGLSGT